MNRREKIAEEIADFILDPVERLTASIRQPVNRSKVLFFDESVFNFDVIPMANKLLPKYHEIDLRLELMGVRNLEKISGILSDQKLRPDEGTHLGFQIMERDIADLIQKELGIKVFGLDADLPFKKTFPPLPSGNPD